MYIHRSWTLKIKLIDQKRLAAGLPTVWKTSNAENLCQDWDGVLVYNVKDFEWAAWNDANDYYFDECREVDEQNKGLPEINSEKLYKKFSEKFGVKP